MRHDAWEISCRAKCGRNQCIFHTDNVQPSCPIEPYGKSESEQHCIGPMACGESTFIGSSRLFASKTNHPAWLALGA